MQGAPSDARPCFSTPISDFIKDLVVYFEVSALACFGYLQKASSSRKLVPGKMIRYVVNTNHHMAYAGGLRTYFSQGTTVVTHQSNRDYYVDILFSPFPRTVDPDHMAIFNPMYMISRLPPPIETVGGTTTVGKYVISDDERQLQIWHVQDMAYEVGESYLKIPGPSLARGNHSPDMLIALTCPPFLVQG